MKKWIKLAYLDQDFSFVRPAGTPNNQAKHSKQYHKSEKSNQGLATPSESLILELIIGPFFHNYPTLRPPFIIPLPPPFPTGGRAEYPRKPTSRRVPGMAANGGRVWRRLHGTRLHGGWLVSIMRVSWWTLNIVYGTFGRPRRWWWSKACDIRFRLRSQHLFCLGCTPKL